MTEVLKNIVLNTDAYKTSHYLQYPPGTTHLASYIEARAGGKYKDVISFGLQAFLKDYMLEPITRRQVDQAEAIIRDGMNLPFNRAGWEHILNKHGGYLPVEIQTVDEGSVIPAGHVTTQIINTDPATFWLPSYLETALLRATWYPNTVATVSWHAKQNIAAHMNKSCDNLGKLPFMLNDFGARGVSSNESSALGGMAHLVNFAGSDTIMGIAAAVAFYGYRPEKQGVPAAEHSTITSWGPNREIQAYQNMLKQFGGPGKILAVVSDSYDLYNALENIWGEALRDDVKNNGAMVVVRPDSGDPVQVVVKSLDILAAKFGTETNSKGYKVLPPFIRLIQGDGVSVTEIDRILTAMEQAGYSADNIVFGMGGELLQKLDRDTQRYAMKASARRAESVDGLGDAFTRIIARQQNGWHDHDTGLSAFDTPGVWQDVFKSPKTDPTKSSKRGILALTFDAVHGYETVRRDELQGRKNLLRTVFRDGRLLDDVTFDQVRQTADETTRRLSALGMVQPVLKVA